MRAKILPAIVLALSTFASAGFCQEQITPGAPSPILGQVVRGNTTIYFERADTRNLDLETLRTWSGFAEEHPAVASSLAHKPSLMNDDAYLARHPELRDFFNAHPDVKSAMAENPGNFVAIPPRPGE